LAQRITFDPPLPTARVLLQRRWIQGPAIKSFVTYARPWWRDAGLAGMAAGDRDVQFTWDASPDDGSLGIIGALIPLTHRTAVEHFGDAATRHAAVLEHLVAYFGPDAAQPLDVRDVSWAEDPWAGGCGAPLPPGVLAAFGPALRAPIGPLVWAGTETATHGNGSMEGAIEAGHRAAREVAGG
jgi:monoamine oxidase